MDNVNRRRGKEDSWRSNSSAAGYDNGCFDNWGEEGVLVLGRVTGRSAKNCDCGFERSDNIRVLFSDRIDIVKLPSQAKPGS